MTLTETRPELALEAQLVPLPAPEPAGFAAYLGTADHKKLGRLYIAVSLLYLLVSLAASALLSFEQADASSLDILDLDSYFQALSLVSQAVVFLGVIPLLLGLGILVTPLQVGSRTIAFPRAAAASFWGFMVGGGMLIGSYAINGGPGGGDAQGVDLYVLSYAILLASLMLGALCVVTTVITLRTPGMYLDRVPLFSWSMVVGGALWLFTLPVVLASLLLAYLDHRYGRVGLGGNYDIYPWLHWAVRPPQVFLYAIPALGIVAEIIPVASGARQRLYKTMMALMVVIGAFGFGAYTVGAYHELANQVVTLDVSSGDFGFYSNWFLVIALVTLPLPVLLLLGGWTDTLIRGKKRQFDAGIVFALSAGLLMLLATSAGAVGAIEPLDLAQTSWMAGVTTLTLGAAIVGGLGGCYWWATKIWGKPIAGGAAVIAAVITLAGVLIAGGGQLVAGVYDQPDAVLVAGTSPETPPVVIEIRDSAEAASMGSTAGWALVAVGVLLVGLAIVGSAVRETPEGEEVPDDPWGGFTLEWATSSPPTVGNFERVALVTSSAPLLDEREAKGGDD